MSRPILFLLVLLAACSSGCLRRWTKADVVTLPQRDNSPLPAATKAPQPSAATAPKQPAGPSWHAEDVLGGYFTLPSGPAGISAGRITGKWPDGSSVTIFDRERDGMLAPEEQLRKVAEFEKEWYRRQGAMKQ